MARFTEKTFFFFWFIIFIVSSTGDSDYPCFYLNFVFAMHNK